MSDIVLNLFRQATEITSELAYNALEHTRSIVALGLENVRLAISGCDCAYMGDRQKIADYATGMLVESAALHEDCENILTHAGFFDRGADKQAKYDRHRIGLYDQGNNLSAHTSAAVEWMQTGCLGDVFGQAGNDAKTRIASNNLLMCAAAGRINAEHRTRLGYLASMKLLMSFMRATMPDIAGEQIPMIAKYNEVCEEHNERVDRYARRLRSDLVL